MDLKNCIECGRSFASKDGEKLCKRCLEKKVEDDFKKVRDYLYDHPGADIKEVSEVTGVEEKIILKLKKIAYLSARVVENLSNPVGCVMIVRR